MNLASVALHLVALGYVVYPFIVSFGVLAVALRLRRETRHRRG